MKHLFYPALLLLFVLPLVCPAQDTVTVGYKQRGMASFYANAVHGTKTASGEIFDMYKMTASHPYIPFNSIVRVTNTANKKWVQVRINDRGPFSGQRIIDLSKGAAIEIDLVEQVTGLVELEVLRIGDGSNQADSVFVSRPDKPLLTETDMAREEILASNNPVTDEDKPAELLPKTATPTVVKAAETPKNTTLPDSASRPNTATLAKNNKPQAQAADLAKDTKKPDAKPKNTEKKKPVEANPEKTPPATTETVTPKNPELAEKFKPVSTYSIWGTPKQPKGFAVQLGSYADVENAIDLGKKAIGEGMEEIYIQSGWADGKIIYRVLFGSGSDQDSVRKNFGGTAEAKGFSGVFIRPHF